MLAHSRTAGGVVASVLCARLVDGGPQRLYVAHRGRLAWQLVDSDGRTALCLQTPSAVRLPHAVVVPQLPTDPASLRIGGGALAWDGASRRVTRWWRPPRPRLPGLRAVIDDAAADRLVRTWPTRLGSGDGLTPHADDVICGALVALHAAEHPAARTIASEMAALDLETRTTATSAGLLRLAADGWCIEPLAAHLAAVAAGGEAAADLEAVGHSSGRGLLAGVDQVMATARRAVAA